MLENCTSGSVAGEPGNRLPYAGCEKRKSMKILISIILFLQLLTSGCATTVTSNKVITDSKPVSLSDEKTWKYLIGEWHGSQTTKEGGNRKEICIRHPDGTYEVEFKSTDKDGVVSNHKEVGLWGVSGSIYFSIFRGWVNNGRIKLSDPSDPYNYDAYSIIILDETEFEYKHVSTGNEYKVIKVTE
jgi:hypothetical protein